MKIEYESSKVMQQCTNLKVAKKLFGGDEKLAYGLLSRINALEEAKAISDIISFKPFRFHKLGKKKKNLEGYFAIDLKSSQNPWRLILQPLDENKQPFIPCDIDKIAANVKIIMIVEVSRHYE